MRGAVALPLNRLSNFVVFDGLLFFFFRKKKKISCQFDDWLGRTVILLNGFQDLPPNNLYTAFDSIGLSVSIVDMKGETSCEGAKVRAQPIIRFLVFVRAPTLTLTRIMKQT